MRKWELERKRKQHDQLVRRAKPTIRRDSGAGPKTSQIVVASKSSGKLGSTGRMGTGEFEDEVFETHTAPIFKLLKAFNLQQYSKVGRLAHYSETGRHGLRNLNIQTCPPIRKGETGARRAAASAPGPQSEAPQSHRYDQRGRGKAASD